MILYPALVVKCAYAYPFSITRVTGIADWAYYTSFFACRQAVKEQNLPWAMLTVQGFQDAPETWSSWEHGYHHHGDNLYTYLIFPNDDYWLYMAVGSNDVIT